MNIGLQMYTVHRHAWKNLPETLEKVSQIGYRGIEFFGDMIWDPAAIRQAISASGLTFTSWHVEWRDLQRGRRDETIEYLQKAGCPIAIIPALGGGWNIGHTQDEECKEAWLSHFEMMEEIRQALSKAGIRCGYHNHAHEFELSYDGKTLFEFIFDSLSREMVIEFDSGNCIEGGGDPLRILDKYSDRDMILHMKPYSRQRGFDIDLADPDDANDWPAILARKEYLWALVESENHVPEEKEFESAKICYDRTKQILQRG